MAGSFRSESHQKLFEWRKEMRLAMPAVLLVGSARLRKALLSTVLLGTIWGCNSDDATNTGPSARIRVVQGARSATALDVLVDDKVVLSGVGHAELSQYANVGVGAHTVKLRRSGSTAIAGEKSLTVGVDSAYTIIAYDAGSAIEAETFADTGAIVPAGKTKLRVLHYASAAPAIDVWRTQPDFSTLTRVMFPFPYRAESPYLQSDPGVWTVVVTAEGSTTPIYSTGNITIPAGKSRTVVLVDAPTSGVEAVILEP
jgi:hypothetical protein